MISYLNPIPQLPTPFGPHKVGTSEWEIPTSEIPSSSQTPDPTISTIKFRLYYPTAPSVTPATIKWLPPPQNQWVEAYSSFLGAGTRLASFLAALPSLIKYTTIPATPDAPLLPRTSASKYPVVVFSHGLGGNFNTYSSVCTSLASFGIVCAAPEHRDGSAPISFIRSASGEREVTIPYQKHSHAPSAEVLNARNAQLRVRLWETEQLFTVLTALHDGKTFTNYAALHDQSQSIPSLRDTLDLRPGHVTWAGHSFGAAATVQFVKSVYYHQHIPVLKGTQYEDNADWRALYTPAENGELAFQITPESPIALLDLWTMPLRGDVTQWLWEKPLPCYDSEKNVGVDTTNTVAIMSAEFHRWTDLLNRTKAALSHEPVKSIAELERRKSTSTSSRTDAIPTPPGKRPSNTPTPFPDEANTPPSSTPSSTDPSRSSTPSPSSSMSSISSPPSVNISTSTGSRVAPGLYLVPHSAHLSQSDFGLLFPNLTRYLMKAQDPAKTIELNVRAILAVMRGRGLEVEDFRGAKTEGRDSLLCEEGVEDRFVKLSLD